MAVILVVVAGPLGRGCHPIEPAPGRRSKSISVLLTKPGQIDLIDPHVQGLAELGVPVIRRFGAWEERATHAFPPYSSCLDRGDPNLETMAAELEFATRASAEIEKRFLDIIQELKRASRRAGEIGCPAPAPAAATLLQTSRDSRPFRCGCDSALRRIVPVRPRFRIRRAGG